MTSSKKRIWGWMAFDWAAQPFYTLGLTFIFGPYFAAVAAEYYLGTGLDSGAAKAQAQSIWSAGQTIAGLFIAFSAPFLGAFADNSGRKMPWIIFFSIIYVITTFMLWGLTPDGAGLFWALILFYVGFVAAESGLNFVNAILPSLGSDEEVGRISGSAAAFGYWGGVTALFFMLLLMAENEQGVTLLGNPPLFGLDPDLREGTRSVGPFIAIWYAIFIIPFFLWVRDTPPAQPKSTSLGAVARDLGATLRSVFRRKSLRSFLIGSMLYRDALNALYAFGGVYAALVLDWQTIQIGVFGIIAAIAAAITTWIAGLADQRYGPKPVIITMVWVLIAVSAIIIGMSREQFFGIPLAEGSKLPDIIFYLCGMAIGGAGGSVYTASRSMMVRHTHPERPAEAFGLFALSGKATAFLAPALITLFTILTGNTQLGFLPVLILFLTGLFLLRWVNKNGDRAEWSDI
ncbi:MFS transporter [Yoonia sediminilitoris]|uniref:UMF1 family MFS transporter n=1 Tax=Yoonia sediminilitoris TaxID=1286148 RepID=A0A2T6K9S9_9RHOB|nr:MFS transporter [Yoonia sediminilitoris]PUB11571.1 UMF1 family MFS transporter [Yoonia sediminilitoris]RCW91771.1 UMF1 family MFS transporter [Yoonia sediminilitoris]